jgi:hypothetical protein
LTIDNGEWRIGDIVEIFDLNGRRVFSHPAPQRLRHGSVQASHPETLSSFTLDISHLPNGTYIVKIGNATAKIVKNHLR